MTTSEQSPCFAPPERAAFCRELLRWHGRTERDLPWRGERDPYRIWISEIMLQQTTTATVSGYYGRFLEAFPTVRALAAADEQAVLKLWEGLGYYSRARSLLAAARMIVSQLGGVFPQDEQALQALPGVGAYTAGAIASMAFDRPALAMDGNLIRALSRLSAETGNVGQAAVKRRLHAFGTALIDPDRPGDFNRAMMGLGRMVCLPASPDCAACPVACFCAAKALGVEKELPVTPPRPEKRSIRRGVALVLSPQGALVLKRPEGGLLSGLWEFPGFDGALDADSVGECLVELGVTGARLRGRGPAVRHVFTHLIWQMELYIFEAPAACAGGRFVTADALRALPMPTAMRAYRDLALTLLDGSTDK